MTLLLFQRRHGPLHGQRHGRGLSALAAVGLLLVGCAGPEARSGDGNGDGEADQGAGLADAPDPGFGHVHGLGLNPADGAVYAATHFGVWRLPPSAGGAGVGPARPLRVADRWQDTMGFTVAGPDVFYGSGHPDQREDAPPHLGFISSRDRAETWQPIALRGEADFHDLAAVGTRVYGYDATAGRLRVSDDAGQTWRSRPPRPIGDVTVDPADPDRVLATTPEGLLVSRDGGSNFVPVRGAPPLVVVDWAAGVLAGVDTDGTVWAAPGAEPGAAWERRGRLTGGAEAFTAVSGGRLLAADGRGVQLSTDGGATWTLLAGYDGSGHAGEQQ